MFNFSIPAQATITPLSVHKEGGGKINCIPKLILSIFVYFLSINNFSFRLSNNLNNLLDNVLTSKFKIYN